MVPVLAFAPKPQRGLRTALVAACFILVLSACGGSEAAEPSGQTEQTQVPGGSIGVFDGDWVLVKADLPADRLEGLSLVLEVDDPTSTIVAHTNCHQRSGSYTVTKGATSAANSATISLPGSTTNACDDESTHLEQVTVDALEAVRYWEREGDELTLSSDSPPEQAQTRLVFRLVG